MAREKMGPLAVSMSAETATDGKLSFTEKFGYGLDDLGLNFMFHAMLALQLSFYTDTFGLTAAQAGTLFLVVGLWTAALNPAMGFIADRTHTRWGRFRPWLLWTAVPLGVVGVLTFTTPDLSPSSKVVYAWITYSLLRLLTMVNHVPQSALTAVITADPDERASVSSFRQFFSNVAGLIVQCLAIPLVVLLGRGNSARGYQLTMGFFSVFSVPLVLFAFAVTKERIQPDPRQKSSMGRDSADLLKNRPWVALFFVTTFYYIGLAIRSSVMLPFFKYCSGNQLLFSWFNGFGLTALLVGITFSHQLIVRFGKRNVFFWGLLLTGIFSIALYWLPATAIVPIFCSEILRQFSVGFSCPLIWAMIADVADYGEWKFGRRASGAVAAAVIFALSLGLALGSAISGWLLAWFGYVANAVQTARSLMGIRSTASIYAGLAYLAAAACLFWYPITREVNRKLANELTERRKSFSSLTTT